ncbi:MAG: YggT family protein [Verrucomicrobia bacterium]|nr:YggT family protein [Verrucomicrobiota bacterium]
MPIIVYAIRLAFSVYTILILIRIIGSWFPRFSHTTFMRFVSYYTDPYLNLFRRLIPPIGGVLDLSPMLAFFSLQILEQLIVSFLFR